MIKYHKILLFINLFLLESYLLRFKIGPYPSNLQEILIGLNVMTLLMTIPFKTILESLKQREIILTFILLTALSFVTTEIINQLDFIRHLKFLFFGSILAFIFLTTFQSDSEKKQGLKVLGLGALAFGIFSLAYNLFGYNVTPDQRLIGPLDAAVYLAYYLAPFFIFFAIESLENPKEKSNILFAFILALLIIATKSMGAIGGSILALLIYVFKRSNLALLKNKITKASIVILVIVASVGIVYSKILPTIQTNYSSLDERGEIWQTSAHLLKNPTTWIFGLGYGQFQENYVTNVEKVLGKKPLDFIVLQPHNFLLLFIFQYGILGLIFIILILYKICQNIFHFKNQPSVQNLATFMLLYFFIHGLIDTPWFKNDLLFILITFAEISLTLNLKKR